MFLHKLELEVASLFWLRHVKSVQGWSEIFSLSRKDRGKCALQEFKLRYTSLSIDRTLQNVTCHRQTGHWSRVVGRPVTGPSMKTHDLLRGVCQ